MQGDRGEGILSLAASVEQGSEHPLGRAMVTAAEERGLSLLPVTAFEATPGRGVRGTVNGERVLVGTRRFVADEGLTLPAEVEAQARALESEGKTVTFAGWDGRAQGLVALGDTVKPSARATVAALRQQGLDVWLVTGDNQATAESIAGQVGIVRDPDGAGERVLAELLPADKAATIAGLQATGRVVCMVGEGINDAPALVQADVGVALGAGTDVAIESADVTILGDDLARLELAFHLAQRTMRVIRANLFWAFAYNVVAIPLAALGVLNPILSAAAMALSSVSVVGNSLRLRK